jgi:hypothetical protein
MQSPEINELATALAKAQGEFGAIPKGELNPFFQSKYAGLPDVVLNASPILSKNGLSISQFIHQNELGEDCLKTYLLHSSGQFIEFSMKLYLGKLDSQAMGSATTYARRYSYMSVLGLVADEDDDAEKAVREPGEYVSNRKVTRLESGNAPEPYDYSDNRPTGTPYVHGSGNDDFDQILQAATLSDNDFIHDLARQIESRGSLSDKQLVSGVKAAFKIMNS